MPGENTPSRPLEGLRAGLLLLVVVSELAGCFFGLPWMLTLSSCLALPAFLLCFPLMGRMVQRISTILIVLGAALLIGTGAGWNQWLLSLRELTGVFGLVAMVRLLVLPWELGGYRETLSNFFQGYRHRPRLLYMVAVLLAYLVSNVLIVGAVPVAGRMLKDSVLKYGVLPTSLVARAVSVGLVTALFFTPIAPLQAVGMQATATGWLELMPLGLTISLTGVVLNALIGLKELGRSKPSPDMAVKGSNPGQLLVATLHFLLVMLGTAVVVLVSENYLDVPPYNLIAMVVVAASFFWALMLGKPAGWMKGAYRYATGGIVANSTEYGLLFSAGFLAVALKGVHPEVLVQAGLNVLNGAGVEWLAYPIITLVIWFGSFTGVHPLALLAIVSGALETSAPVLSAPAYYVSLVAGAAFSYMTSPFSISLLIISGLMNSNTVEVGWKWNRPFTVVFTPLVMAIAALVALLNIKF